MLFEKSSDLPRMGPAAGREEGVPQAPGLPGGTHRHLEGRRR